VSFLNRWVTRNLSRQGWVGWLLLPSLTIGCAGGGGHHSETTQTHTRQNATVVSSGQSSSGVAVTGFTQTHGPAGSRISMTGRGLSSIERVTFGQVNGPDLAINGDTELQVTMPPDGQGEEITLFSRTGEQHILPFRILAVGPKPSGQAPAAPSTPAPAGTNAQSAPGPVPGGETPAPAPSPAPPRTGRFALLDSPFTIVERPWEGASRCLDFPGARRTAQYGDLFLPQAPVFHPYSPWIDDDGSIRPGFEHPEFTLNLRLPADFWEAVPAQVLGRMAEMNLQREQTDLLCVSQNQPWTGTGVGTMLFRPHYWVYPEAPCFGTFSQDMTLRVALPSTLGNPGQVALVDGGSATSNAGISTHDSGPGTLILSSPNNLVVSGLTPDTSHAVWTLVARPDGRAAVTLHLVLNDPDQAILGDISRRANNLGQLMTALSQGTAADSAVFHPLRELVAPVIRTVSSAPSPVLAGHVRIHLEGSGFAGITGIRVGSHLVAERVVHGESDCHFVIPDVWREAPVILVTALGDSRPMPLR
jgi:hypothetical protein